MPKAWLTTIVLRLTMLLLTILAPVAAQITPDDAPFGKLNSSSMLMAYKQAGGETSQIEPLMATAEQSLLVDLVKANRGYTHALVLMAGKEWTPETKLTPALDIFKADGTLAAVVEPVIALGNVNAPSRKHS